jgi:hypothetical protein
MKNMFVVPTDGYDCLLLAFLLSLLLPAAGPASGTIPARGQSKAGSVHLSSSRLAWHQQQSGRLTTVYPSLSMGWGKTRPGRSAAGAPTKPCE